MKSSHWLVALGVALLAAVPVHAAGAACVWQPGWASSQYVAEGDNVLPAGGQVDHTLREIVRTSLAGKAVRVRLSNAFGTAPLAIDAASLAPSPDNHAAAR